MRYLDEIRESAKRYDAWVERRRHRSHALPAARLDPGAARRRDSGDAVLPHHEIQDGDGPGVTALVERYQSLPGPRRRPAGLEDWPALKEQYAGDVYEFKVRDKVLRQPLTMESLERG